MTEATDRVEAVQPGRFPPYLEYRDSGVDWLGQVPWHWETVRLRFVVDTGATKADVRALDPATEVSFVPMEAVGEYGALDLDATKPLSEVIDGYTCFRDGDVIVAKITPCFENGKGALASSLCGGIGFGTTELHVLRPSRHVDARFLLYLTFSDPFRRIGAASMYGAGGQKRISDDFVRNFRHPLPGLAEQRAIANFLDRETAKIDALVTRKERLIELLQEKRTALITRAVTRGLDPNVPMQDSGVEWLGEIPAHWTVLSLGRVTISRCDGPFGSGLKSEHYSESGVRVVRLQNIGWAVFSDQDASYLDEAYYTGQLGDHGVNGGDLLIAGLGDDRQPVGRACVAPIEIEPAMVKADCFRFRLDRQRVLPRYVAFQLSATATVVGGYYATGATRMRVNLATTTTRKIALPPFTDQKAIADFLDRETAQIDALVAKVHEAIAHLRELRTALISAAVTGKIDVREATPR